MVFQEIAQVGLCLDRLSASQDAKCWARALISKPRVQAALLQAEALSCCGREGCRV